MGTIGDDLGFVLNQEQTPTDVMPQMVEAQVLSADALGLFVTIPSFHPDFRFGPCTYSWPVQGFPPVDSVCLVQFVGNDLSRPYVAAWADAPRTPLRLTGAPAETRFVGGTTSGPPATGDFRVGDFVVDQTGLLWICRTAGSPGGWRSSQDKPVGDVELSLALKPNQLALVGQTVLRSAYPALWAWAQAKSLVIPGLFGVGDGSTTFVLPNLSGRVPVGVGTLGADTYALGGVGGSTLKTLLTANIPEHDHQITVDAHGNHHHDLTGGTVPSGGNHGGHFPGTTVNVGSGAGTVFGLAAWNSGGVDSGNHGHGAVAVFAIDSSAGAHTVRRTALPAATAFDARPAYSPFMYAIWY